LRRCKQDQICYDSDLKIVARAKGTGKCYSCRSDVDIDSKDEEINRVLQNVSYTRFDTEKVKQRACDYQRGSIESGSTPKRRRDSRMSWGSLGSIRSKLTNSTTSTSSRKHRKRRPSASSRQPENATSTEPVESPVQQPDAPEDELEQMPEGTHVQDEPNEPAGAEEENAEESIIDDANEEKAENPITADSDEEKVEEAIVGDANEEKPEETIIADPSEEKFEEAVIDGSNEPRA
jgi:hypothetical protein